MTADQPGDEWELFLGRHTRPEGEPTATIQAKGNLSLNAPAWRAIGQPTAVELLWNRSKQLVGIRPTAPGLEHAYKLRQRERATTTNHVVSFIAFANRYGIPIKTAPSRRFVVDVRDGMLILDLKKKPVEIKRSTYKKPRE